MSVFNERFKQLRDENNMTSKQLASNLGITESRLSYYMNGNREPGYELLISIAKEFSVTTDYLTGNSNQKNPTDERLIKSIQSSSEATTINSKRKELVENFSVDFHQFLVKLADLEIKTKGLQDVWDMVKMFIKGLNSYYDFLCELETSENPYPIDEAKIAMDTISKARSIAFDRVDDLIRNLLGDDKADKILKDRIVIKQSIAIRDKVTLAPTPSTPPEESSSGDSL